MVSSLRDRRGFTLVEALVAMTLATVMLGLVGSVFLAQSRFYEDVLRRSEAQENARSVVEMVSTDVRPLSVGGVVLAESARLAVRLPLVVGMVCRVTANAVEVYLPLNQDGLEESRVAGYGLRSPEGEWAYHSATWGDLSDGSGQSVANRCEDAGMDVDGVPLDHFLRLRGPEDAEPPPERGTTLMLYHDLELRYDTSDLDPGGRALFRGPYGEALVEMATGMAPNAHFEYRLEGETTFRANVAPADLEEIRAVRVVAAARSGERDLRRDPYDFELALEIPLRNVE